MFLLTCFGTSPSLCSSVLSPELGASKGHRTCQQMLALHSPHVMNYERVSTLIRNRYATVPCLYHFKPPAILSLQEDNTAKQNKECLLKMSNQNHQRAAGVIMKLTKKQHRGRSELQKRR